MNQSRFVFKLAAVVSSLLLVTSYISFQAGILYQRPSAHVQIPVTNSHADDDVNTIIKTPNFSFNLSESPFQETRVSSQLHDSATVATRTKFR